jgi:hypothetical protein
MRGNPMADVLPGYIWDATTKRYRAVGTGRYVSRRDILSLLDGSINTAQDRLGALTAALHEGSISPAVWTDQMRTELRRLHLQNRALAAGGWDNLTPRDFGAIGYKLRDDYQRLSSFARDIINGDSTLAQSLSRSNMYAGRARTNFWEAERDRATPSASDRRLIERRLLGAAEHCRTCISLYNDGWQPAGVLPIPGDGSTECLTNDRCVLERREVPLSELDQWIGTRKRSNDQPIEAPAFVRSQPSAANIEKARNEALEKIAAYAEIEGVTAAVYEKRVRQSLTDLMVGKAIQMQFPTPLADKLLESGRFKTQFETGDSMAIFDPEMRADAEFYGTGLPTDLDVQKRPVYGYVKSYEGQEWAVAGQYGDLTFVLKDSVRQRTGYTVGDSLHQFVSRLAVSAPIDEVQLESMGVGVRHLYEYDKLRSQIGDTAAAEKVFNYLEYIEVQIQDGVVLTDVATILDPEGGLSSAQIAKFKAFGITVKQGK